LITHCLTERLMEQVVDTEDGCRVETAPTVTAPTFEKRRVGAPYPGGGELGQGDAADADGRRLLPLGLGVPRLPLVPSVHAPHFSFALARSASRY
jgi:hypothetical protein